VERPFLLARQRERRLEALELTPEPVPLDRDVDHAEQVLPAALRADDRARKENSAGARAPHRRTRGKRADGLVEGRQSHEQRDRGRFCAE
jgi:hypothetical protein